MTPIDTVLGESDRQQRPAWLWMFAGGVVAVLFATGCGSNGPSRYHLGGRVTFGGEPVPNGLIRFEPDATKGNGGPVGYASIIDGRYTTAEQGSKGALKGPLVVVLSGGPAPDPKVEFPVQWFVDHVTTIELDPKPGVTTFDIDVPRKQTQKAVSGTAFGKIAQ